jgi:ketosteroid isomerase-like protein
MQASWLRVALTEVYGGRNERIRDMAQGKITESDVAELVRSTAGAASAYIRGDIHRYLTLIKHGDNYTLMPPYGGEPKRGFNVEEALETTPRMFRGGEADLELVATYASGDMAVLVAIERQHGEVGGMPDQDWSLRVTLVFRHEGAEWQLVHRHADPLVHAISMEHVAVLARGQG